MAKKKAKRKARTKRCAGSKSFVDKLRASGLIVREVLPRPPQADAEGGAVSIALSYEEFKPYLRMRPGRYEIDQICNMQDRERAAAKQVKAGARNPHAHHWKAKRGRA